MSNSRLLLITTYLLLALVGCTGGGILSPHVDYDSPNARSANYRTVIRGDTLFSIAWDVGVDFRTLAEWNDIGSPYVIRPGQRLRITAPAPARSPSTRSGRSAKGKASSEYYRVKKGDTVYSIARENGTSTRSIIAWNGLKKPYAIYPGQKLRVSGASNSGARSSVKSNQTPSYSSPPANKGRPQQVGRWVWPTSGTVVRRYSPQGTSKGIDIRGKPGQDVIAAASGTVVYQGSGLRGYGQLIIIKHNSDFLSAYAHCSRILVKEGERVKRGQQIATMGSTGTNSVKLHFEIRLRGNPVNPIKYLPKHT
ncbi:MAG: peptidoglycan DD-metalloendopeptidase family protein [Acidiferrobacterales bacterium]|jgi:lipoprotein NlpD|nr:peptidoglycan DD-metalloendopeptidase family protein [Acidiferrobacterales bacterium]